MERHGYSSFTGRELGYYLGLSGKKLEDLVGKTILNLGGGWGDLTADAARRGQEIKVVSIDPRYRTHRKKAVDFRVAARVEELPIASESVDFVFASSSLFPWVFKHSPPAAIAAINEIARVLKPGGEAFCFPVNPLFLFLKDRGSVRRALKQLENLPQYEVLRRYNFSIASLLEIGGLVGFSVFFCSLPFAEEISLLEVALKSSGVGFIVHYFINNYLDQVVTIKKKNSS